MNLSISRDGTEIGEWTEEEVRAFYDEGRLIASDLYWREGMAAWDSLASFIKPPPPFPTAPALAAIKTSVSEAVTTSEATKQDLRSILGRCESEQSQIRDTKTTAVDRDWRKKPASVSGCIGLICAFIGMGIASSITRQYMLIIESSIGVLGTVLLAVIPYLVIRFTIGRKSSLVTYPFVIWGACLIGGLLGILMASPPTMSLHDQLVAISDGINKQSPKQVDEVTRLDRTNVDTSNVLHYCYTVLGVANVTDETKLQQFHDNIKPNVVNAYKNIPALEFLRKNKVTISYDYFDSQGNLLTKVVVGPEDLQ